MSDEPMGGASAPAGVGEHALDLDLVKPELDPVTDRHLLRCSHCSNRRRRALANASESGRFGDEVLDESRFLAQLELSAAARTAVALPTGVAQAMQAEPRRPEVRPGQVWRLKLGKDTVLAAPIEIRHWWILVAPVTGDVDLADEHALVLNPVETGLGVPLAAWAGAAATVPLSAFDRLVAEPALEGGLSSGAALQALWQASAHDRPLPVSINTGHPLHEHDVDTTSLLDALTEDMAPFVGLLFGEDDGTESVTGARDASTTQGEQLKLIDLVRAFGNAARLSDLTGIDRPTLLKLTRPGARASREQAAALAPALGLRAAEILAANPPLDDVLVARASRPGLRPRRERWARGRGIQEADAALALSEHMLSVAARTTGPRAEASHSAGRSEADWDALLNNVLGADE